MKTFKCCLCGKVTHGYGNNPYPLGKEYASCCDHCNEFLVIPARIDLLFTKKRKSSLTERCKDCAYLVADDDGDYFCDNYYKKCEQLAYCNEVKE